MKKENKIDKVAEAIKVLQEENKKKYDEAYAKLKKFMEESLPEFSLDIEYQARIVLKPKKQQ